MYKVIENRYVGEDMYLMRVEGKFEGKMGQFYMLRAWDKFPLLSRPISIHDIDDNSISFLYKVVGEGTQILSKVKTNETIKLEGPYGNGYEKVEGKVALVGGGIGVAPLYLVAKNIENCDAYLGFRKEAILEEEASGNEIHFIVSGKKISETDISAIQQISGIENLNCGDVEVTVTLSDSGCIHQLLMNFDASVKYQGYDADVAYKVQYNFS